MISPKKIFWLSCTLFSIIGYGGFVFAATLTPGQTLDPVADMLCTGPSDPDCGIIFNEPVLEIESGSGIPLSAPTGTDPLIYVDDSTGDLYTYDGSTWNIVSSGGGSSPFTIENTGSIFSTGLTNTGSGSNASYSFFVGQNAGYQAANAGHSNFLGSGAGENATDALYSNFMGYTAGFGATDAQYSNFFGSQAGQNALDASYSNFFGPSAGNSATSASYSNFIGFESGKGAQSASHSIFLGSESGSGAANAPNSIFIGTSSGKNDTVDNILTSDGFSILIGNNTSTGGFSNSIAIGANATNTAVHQFMIGSAARPISETIIVLDSIGGECVIDNTGVNCSSDESLKSNITPLEGTLDTLHNIIPVTYTWNSSDQSAIGFSAQNVQEYYPDIVKEGSQGYLVMNYANLVPVLTKAIQELDVKMEMVEKNAQVVYTDSETSLSFLIQWFADKANGITEFFAGRIRTDELCVGEVCVNESQLQQLLENYETNIDADENSETEIIPEETIGTPEEPEVVEPEIGETPEESEAVEIPEQVEH